MTTTILILQLLSLSLGIVHCTDEDYLMQVYNLCQVKRKRLELCVCVVYHSFKAFAILDSILYLWKSVGYAFDTVDLYQQRALRISGCRSDHERHEQQSEAIETPFQIELADSLEAESRPRLR